MCLAVATRIRFRVAPYDRHGRALSLGLFLRIIFALGYVVDGVHATHHVVGEEKFSIGRDHHDLQLVREALRHDLVNEQRILFQDDRFLLHALSVSYGSHANAIGLGLESICGAPFPLYCRSPSRQPRLPRS